MSKKINISYCIGPFLKAIYFYGSPTLQDYIIFGTGPMHFRRKQNWLGTPEAWSYQWRYPSGMNVCSVLLRLTCPKNQTDERFPCGEMTKGTPKRKLKQCHPLDWPLTTNSDLEKTLQETTQTISTYICLEIGLCPRIRSLPGFRGIGSTRKS